ncbi:MAG: Death on curing protein, Doc toxin [uncultured Sulfurovum sp.]|uniref:mRNA interferase n=1 Tax=uncultured Sulfurovum sp. TaxID=269237 RepID=A0A6S6SUS6_9BACT|nr:MAG: Death on curing protein, Doc toxin [uncultured Sulfurovum sp.]
MTMEMSMNIKQGEIWMVEFFPKVGSESTKLRPAIVVSHNQIGRLPLKTIVPISDWKNNYAHYPWILKIENDTLNGLSKTSAIDCFQIKNFANERFVKKVGSVDEIMIKKVHETIAKTLNPIYTLK